MMNINTIQWQDFDKTQFLNEYWQQKPLLIRQAFDQFDDLLSPDELAGLACEPSVQSRLIYQQQGKWQAESGPFEDYSHLGEQDWSLVLQAVDNWVPQVGALTEAFDFLPDWRRDDVMVSFATKGGSVGPHIDNYDTFICQGSGSRHWQVGDKGQHQQYSAHEMLLHVKSFDAIIDEHLQAGDVLYIPPGYPHQGIALEPSMSFSVGFRTESAKEMLSSFADHLIDHDLANQLLIDPKRAASQHNGLIDNQDLARIRKHLLSALADDNTLAHFCGSHLSEPKHSLDAPESPYDYSEEQIVELLQQMPLIRLEGLRCYYLEQTVTAGFIYLNGEAIELPTTVSQSIKNLCNQRIVEVEDITDGLKNPAFLSFLTTYINQGCWYFAD